MYIDMLLCLSTPAEARMVPATSSPSYGSGLAPPASAKSNGWAGPYTGRARVNCLGGSNMDD